MITGRIVQLQETIMGRETRALGLAESVWEGFRRKFGTRVAPAQHEMLKVESELSLSYI